MALKKMRIMCDRGEETLAEWDTETISPARLAKIEAEFNEKLAQGYFAADVSVADPEKGTDGKQIRKFDPKAEILLIPRFQGG